MDFLPSRALGLSIAGSLLLISVLATVLGIVKLASAQITPLIILWLILPMAGVPLAILAGYRMYGLFSARYHIDRDGFYLLWGLAQEQIPISEIRSLKPASEVSTRLLPKLGLWWPGCIVGSNSFDGLGLVEFFATSSPEKMLVLSAGERHFAISPQDPQTFQRALVDSMRMGSLERIASHSQRPDFLTSRLWSDPFARVLILSGLVLPLSLLAFLVFRVQYLPPSVPFGFDPAGVPAQLAPSARLLLLPFIGALCWIGDTALGTWLFRSQEDNALAYALWGTAIVVGILLWGAALHMLAAA